VDEDGGRAGVSDKDEDGEGGPPEERKGGAFGCGQGQQWYLAIHCGRIAYLPHPMKNLSGLSVQAGICSTGRATAENAR